MKIQSPYAIAVIAVVLVTCASEVGAATLYVSQNSSAPVPPKLPSQPVLSHSFFNPATNAQAGAQQGYSVAMDGNLVVVGIPGVPGIDNVQAENSGAVKIYDATT